MFYLKNAVFSFLLVLLVVGFSSCTVIVEDEVEPMPVLTPRDHIIGTWQLQSANIFPSVNVNGYYYNDKMSLDAPCINDDLWVFHPSGDYHVDDDYLQCQAHNHGIVNEGRYSFLRNFSLLQTTDFNGNRMDYTIVSISPFSMTVEYISYGYHGNRGATVTETWVKL